MLCEKQLCVFPHKVAGVQSAVGLVSLLSLKLARPHPAQLFIIVIILISIQFSQLRVVRREIKPGTVAHTINLALQRLGQDGCCELGASIRPAKDLHSVFLLSMWV